MAEFNKGYYRRQGRKEGIAMERERIIELFAANHYENTWEHFPIKWVYMENCMACDALSLIKGENKAISWTSRPLTGEDIESYGTEGEK